MRLALVLCLALLSGTAASAHPMSMWQQNIVPPHALVCNRSLVYPPAAVRADIEGDTKLTYRIAVDGATKDVRVEHSSGRADLDAAAVAAARCWRYQPAMKNGKAVEVPWHAVIRWRLVGPRWHPPRTWWDWFLLWFSWWFA